MNFILSIDTAVTEASVCLSNDAEILALKTNHHSHESAAWLHTAIQQLLHETTISIHQLAAVAVSAGPGSYTGLRVGMAAAKGLCYALQIPLITINTLHMMAVAALNEPTDLLCPMIDARRMEVFTGLYTKALDEVLPAQAVILDAHIFSTILGQSTITFFGNGSQKFQTLMHHPHAVFKNINADASHLSALARQAFQQKKFADLAYSEPFYGKEFFSPAHKQ